jgi:hypothetical protein
MVYARRAKSEKNLIAGNNRMAQNIREVARTKVQEVVIEQDLRQLFELKLPDRIKRHLEVKPHPIVANHHFSTASAECIELFRDGYFYGCIALTQAVAEALVKFLCKRNGWRPSKVFEKNVDTLRKRNFIADGVKKSLLQVWDRRDDYHHLNHTIETDRNKLETLAREKMRLLNDVEAEIFQFTFVDGKIAPTQPKYWDIDGGKADVYLRCEL